MDDVTLERILGADLNCPHLRDQIRKHGDGYTMHLRVASVEVLREDVDVVVLFAMTSPKLNRDSVFGGTPLHEIPYWRDSRRLCPEVQVESQTYRLLFLSWQQKCSIHGKNDAHALRNRKLLNKGETFRRLLEQEPQLASEYIKALGQWCHVTDRAFLLFRHHQRQLEDLQPALLHLVRSNKAVCMSTSLRGPKNYKIMDCLIPGHLRAFAIKHRQRSAHDNEHGSLAREAETPLRM